MTQAAFDMPDRLRPPFYIEYYRYGVKYREEYDTLEEALGHLRAGEEFGELSAHECGDQDGWLWRRPEGVAVPFDAAERAPARPDYFFYDEPEADD